MTTRTPVALALAASALLASSSVQAADPLDSYWTSCVALAYLCPLDLTAWQPVPGGPGFPFEQSTPLGLQTNPSAPDQVWLRATETGSVRAYVSTGAPQGGSPDDPRVQGAGSLLWQGTYLKPQGSDVARFTINKTWLEVAAQYTGNQVLGRLDQEQASYAAFWFTLTVKRNANGRAIYRSDHLAHIQGRLDGSPPQLTFHKVLFEGDTHQTAPDYVLTFPFQAAGALRAEWAPVHGTVSLAGLNDLETYTVTYELWVSAGIDYPEFHAEAFLGDPFDPASGFTWETTAFPASPPIVRQTCPGPLDAGRWTLGPAGTVTDGYTGLTWRRCGAGRTFDDGGTPDDPGDDRCTGSDLGGSWQQALQAAVDDRTGGFADWRLPSAKELESLVDVSCAAPAIETRIFPNTSTSLWWTGTPDPSPGRSRLMSFWRGEPLAGARSALALMRVVRDAGVATRAPLPALSLGRPLEVVEGNAGSSDLVFPVTLDRPAASDVAVDYTTRDVTARAGEDYLAVAGTLTIPAGALRGEIRVPVLGDTTAEPDEYLAVALSNVSPTARLRVVERTGKIVDDEPLVSVGDARVVEGNAGTVQLGLPVTLSRAAPADVVVRWATADGTATAGVDYAAASGSLTIPAGQTAGTIAVEVTGDREVEPDETLTVTLASAGGNAQLARSTATGTIVNDDVAGPPVVDAVRHVGSMGGAGNADGTGQSARFGSPSWITDGLLVDGSRIRAYDHGGNVTSPFSALFLATGIALAPDGSAAFIAEGTLNRVQRLARDGTVTTLAGSGAAGSADGNGPSATFRGPSGLAADAAGNVYVADSGNFTIRMITPSGDVTTLAGLAGSAGSADGNGPAARFVSPRGLAIHPTTGLLYVGDRFAVRSVTAGGVVTTLAGSTSAVGAVDSADPLLARFRSTDGLAVDGSGNVYVADASNAAIRKIDPAAGVTTLAGAMGQSGTADGTGGAARFRLPVGIAFSADFLWVTDNNNFTLRRVSLTGEVVTSAGEAPVTGGTDGSAATATFNWPTGVAPGSAPGQLFVAERFGQTIRRIDPDGSGNAATVATVAGRSGSPGSTDGTGGAARFSQPFGVSAGGSFVADTGNCTLRAIDAQAAVTTVAGAVQTCAVTDGTGTSARLRSPLALWTASSGTVYVADAYAVRAFDPATGGLTTVAGGTVSGNVDGTGGAARFAGAQGLCGDAAGNLYVADGPNNAIRKIAPGGVVTTLTGGGGYQDGPLAGARFRSPGDVACGADGTLYVADTDNVVLRKITPAGEVSTILGTAGLIGFAPMAGPSVIGKPVRLTLQGNLLYVTMYHGILRVTLP